MHLCKLCLLDIIGKFEFLLEKKIKLKHLHQFNRFIITLHRTYPKEGLYFDCILDNT